MNLFIFFRKLRKRFRSNVVLISGVVIMISLLFLIYSIEKANGSTMFQTFWDAIWWGIVTAATIGYGDKFPQSFYGQLFATGYIIIALGIFTQLVSILLDFIFTNNTKKMTGTLKYDFTNHTVISGKNDAKSFNVIRQFSNEFPNENMVFVSEGDSIPNEIKEIFSKTGNIFWVSGNLESVYSIENCNLSKAKKIVILSKGDDNKTLSDVMFARSENKNALITVDYENDNYKNILLSAGANTAINTSELSSNLISRSVTDKTDIMLSDILSNSNGHEVYLVDIESDIKFSELKKKYADSDIQIVGILNENNEMVYSGSYTIKSGKDKVYIFSENRTKKL